jgi:hypothetical protein
LIPENRSLRNNIFGETIEKIVLIANVNKFHLQLILPRNHKKENTHMIFILKLKKKLTAFIEISRTSFYSCWHHQVLFQENQNKCLYKSRWSWGIPRGNTSRESLTVG